MNKCFRALPWQELLPIQERVRKTVIPGFMWFCIKMSVFFIKRFAAHEEIDSVKYDDLYMSKYVAGVGETLESTNIRRKKSPPEFRLLTRYLSSCCSTARTLR